MADTVIGDKATTTSCLRLLSLDFFRGFIVAAMILVNGPGIKI